MSRTMYCGTLGPMRGQAAFEYVLLLAVIGLVLVTGEESPLEQLVRAIQDYHGRFTFALALP